jgi:uncharacterized protein YaiL (DUF2058 family)
MDSEAVRQRNVEENRRKLHEIDQQLGQQQPRGAVQKAELKKRKRKGDPAFKSSAKPTTGRVPGTRQRAKPAKLDDYELE